MLAASPLDTEEFRSLFGLKALQDALNAQAPERSVLETGIDLTRLGLRLSANASLAEGFKNPFSDKSAFPNFYELPGVYPPPAELSETQVAALKEKTLFYLFYNAADVRVQRLAALRLCTFDWTYDKRLKTWFRLKELQEQSSSVTLFSLESWGQIKTSIDSHPADRLGTKEFQAL